MMFQSEKLRQITFLMNGKYLYNAFLWDYNVNVWMKTKKKRTHVGALPIAECIDGLRIRNACQHFCNFFHAFFKGF